MTSTSASSITPDPHRRTIIVIGAGYGGLRFFSESLDLAVSTRMTDAIRYVYVDERPFTEYGRGVAWASDQNSNMRANMHSPEITIDPTTRKTVAEILGISYDQAPTATELFTQREKIGHILADKFQDTYKRAGQFHVPFFAVQDQAVDITRVGISFKVLLKGGDALLGDSVVLALGHIPSTEYPHLFHSENYIRNPWIGIDDNVPKLAAKGDIAILGLGPTAVDTIIKLRDGGIPLIRAYSRSGAMQYPRPIPKSYTPKIVTQENIEKVAHDMRGLRLNVLLGMIFSEFIVQEVDWRPLMRAVDVSMKDPLTALSQGYAECKSDSDWFGLAASLTSSLPAAWNALAEEDRADFRAFHRRLSNVLYGMAPSHALRMLTELEDRTLVVKGGLLEVTPDPLNGRFRLSVESEGGIDLEYADVVVDCTGFGTDLTRSETPLIANLVRRGILKPHKFGGAEVDFESGQVTGELAGRAMEIYCLTGSMNIGTRFVTNGLGHVAASAKRTARAIHRRL